MKVMSEALQRAAGSRLKTVLGKMTSNRFTGVLSGLFLTTVVQSSSASTVMVVSFVSAGLLTLTQAIGMIMGANIGTTLTAWIVSMLGFKVKIGAFALPAIGIGMAMTYMRSTRAKQWGEVLLGFGLLFLGVSLLKDAIPPIDGPEQISFVKDLAGYGFLSTLIFIGVGLVLTLALQSSSATTTLTLTMAAMGWLPYSAAVAMILGENIGTTATANLAAIGGPVNAKRAARVHLLFNVFGVTWALALLHVYLLPFADFLVPGNPSAPQVDQGVITTHLAAVHTIFNVTNTALMLPLVRQLGNIVTRWVPEKKVTAPSRLRYLTPAGIETPELLIVQASREMQHMTEVVQSMFSDALQILTHPDAKLGQLVDQTLQQEQVVDDLEREISEILTDSTSAGTSPHTARQIGDMIQNTHRLERVGDHCAVLVRIARRVYDSGHHFSPEDVADLTALGTLVDEALGNLGAYLAGDVEAAARSEQIETRVDATRRELRNHRIERLKHETGDQVKAQLAMLDVLTHLEEVADRAVGIIRLAESTRRAA